MDQLRALSDPVRLRVIDALTEREGTVATLAKSLGETPARLYPHVESLLEAGLLEVAARIPRRGAEERLLRAVARDYVLDRSLFGSRSDDNGSLETMLELARSMLTGAVEDLTEGVRTGSLTPTEPGKSFFIEGRQLALSPASFGSLVAKLGAVATELAEKDDGVRRSGYRLVMVAYPLSRGGGAGKAGPRRSSAAASPRKRARSGS